MLFSVTFSNFKNDFILHDRSRRFEKNNFIQEDIVKYCEIFDLFRNISELSDEN